MKVSDSCSHDGENSQIGMSAFRVSSLTAYLERVEKFISERNKEGMSLKSQAQTKWRLVSKSTREIDIICSKENKGNIAQIRENEPHFISANPTPLVIPPSFLSTCVCRHLQ